MKWTTVSSVRSSLLKKWEKGMLISRLFDGQIIFPYRIPLTLPSSKDMLENFESVRTWIRTNEKQEAGKEGNIEWKEISHRQLGKNHLPSGYTFNNEDELLKFIGKKQNYQRFISLSSQVLKSYPVLRDWIVKSPLTFIENEKNMDRLLSVISWILHNPLPGIYLRQLSLSGVDTKFIEQNRKFLSEALDRLQPEKSIHREFSGTRNFEKRYGFLSKPEMIRFRYPAGPPEGVYYSDMVVRADEFCRKNLEISRVFIIENDVTALAFPPVRDSLVLFGRGYFFDSLADAHWLHDKKLYYWGDIDTHGLSILSQFRGHFPGTVSILMDEKTLLTHNNQWSFEKSPAKAVPQYLTEAERDLYSALENNTYGENIRLEQEFVSFDVLNQVIEKINFH